MTRRIGLLLGGVLTLAGCRFPAAPVPDSEEPEVVVQAAEVPSDAAPAEVNLPELDLPGVVTYRGAGVMRWPGSLAPADLLPAYHAGLSREALVARKRCAEHHLP